MQQELNDATNDGFNTQILRIYEQKQHWYRIFSNYLNDFTINVVAVKYFIVMMILDWISRRNHGPENNFKNTLLNSFIIVISNQNKYYRRYDASVK